MLRLPTKSPSLSVLTIGRATGRIEFRIPPRPNADASRPPAQAFSQLEQRKGNTPIGVFLTATAAIEPPTLCIGGGEPTDRRGNSNAVDPTGVMPVPLFGRWQGWLHRDARKGHQRRCETSRASQSLKRSQGVLGVAMAPKVHLSEAVGSFARAAGQ